MSDSYRQCDLCDLANGELVNLKMLPDRTWLLKTVLSKLGHPQADLKQLLIVTVTYGCIAVIYSGSAYALKDPEYTVDELNVTRGVDKKVVRVGSVEWLDETLNRWLNTTE